MPRALIISFVEWSGAFQRPQHQAVEMARQGWDVTYLGPAYPHRGEAGLGAGFDLPENLHLRTARAMPGGRILSVIERYNESSFRREAAEMNQQDHGAVWDAVIFNDPRWAEAASATRARVRVWDRMDDLSESAPTEAWGREREADALRLADLIWTGTPSLADLSKEQLREAGLKKPVRFVACGVDAERFAAHDDALVERAREEMGGNGGSRPIALYFGALNERLNGKFVEALLEAGWKVALIGPGSSRAPRLRACEGLRVLGPRPYDALPSYLAAADAGLIPYHVEGSHRHLYPVKALEYLAGGKPVLSTPLPNVEKLLGDFVWTGEFPDEWTELALNWKKQRAKLQERALAGQAFVRERTWSAMATDMIQDVSNAGQAIRKEGRGDAVPKVRPAGSEDLKTGTKEPGKKKKKKKRGAKSRTRSGETGSRETGSRETKAGSARKRKTKSGETRARETKSREAKHPQTQSRDTKSRESRRSATCAPPSIPPRKFDVRGKEDWGSQSLLERLTNKKPPATPPASEDRPEAPESPPK